MDFNIKDETSKLNVVMLGIATDMGKKPVLQKCYDPKSIENIITINRNQMYQMYSNVFSISNDLIISEENFSILNHELSKRGFKVETVKYSEISKMSGLLRCSTMPLKREG